MSETTDTDSGIVYQIIDRDGIIVSGRFATFNAAMQECGKGQSIIARPAAGKVSGKQVAEQASRHDDVYLVVYDRDPEVPESLKPVANGIILGFLVVGAIRLLYGVYAAGRNALSSDE